MPKLSLESEIEKKMIKISLKEHLKTYRQRNREWANTLWVEMSFENYMKKLRQRSRERKKERERLKEHKRRARKKGNGGILTATEILRLRKKSEGICLGFKCESHFVGEDKLTIDHIVPIAKGGRNSIENIQLLCLSCNCSKGVN